MRTIKFRAWDKSKQQWLNDSWLKYVCPNDGVVALITYAPDSRGGYEPKSCRQLTNRELHNLEISQFTGLHDKNGKEIYEGDIFEHISANGQRVRHKVFYFESSATWSIANVLTNPHAWREGEEEYEVEVIGNIYETPVLSPAPVA